MTTTVAVGRWRLLSMAALLAFLAAIHRPGPPLAPLVHASDILQLVLLAAAVVACVVAAKRSPRSRAFWNMVGLGCFTWAVGQAIWAWKGIALGPPPILPLSDIFFIGAGAPLAIAVVVRPDRPHDRGLALAFDVALLAAFALHVYVYFALGHLLAGDVVSYERWFSILSDVRGVAVVLAWCWLVRTSARPWRPLHLQLAAAISLFHLGSVISDQAFMSGEYYPGLYDIPYTVPFLWIALVAASWRPPLAEGDTAPAPAPAWSDTRWGTAVALSSVVMVAGLHLLASDYLPASAPLAALRTGLTFVTTAGISGLFLLRQLDLLGRLEGSQRQRQEALLLSEERFARAFHSSPAALSISTLADGRIIDINERYQRLTGYTREELLGRTGVDLGLWAFPEERQALLRALQGARSVKDFRVRFRHKSGELRQAVTSYERMDVGGEACLLGLNEDVTEKQRLEGQLQQAQKMEAVGRLAGGIAHDFNNLLTVILGHSELMLGGPMNDPASLRGSVEQVQRAGDRAAALTAQLLTFSRKQVTNTTVLDLATVITRLCDMLRRLIGEDVELVNVAAPGLGKVRADPGQIEQVVVNLAVNARDAMPEGGRLTIEVRGVELDAAFAEEHVGSRMGPHVMLAVTDTGTGIPLELQRHIFEPFFTTKEPGKGTGLGLATVYGIVKQSDGYISLDTAPGRGTTFRIYFPRVDEPVPAPPPERVRVMARGSETILLVEDDRGVREMARRILEECGYNVLAAASGDAAVEVSGGYAREIHLVLTDVVMPGLSGRRAAEAILALRPAVKVLYASGYTDDTIVHHGVLEEGTAFLPKPYTPVQLAARVRELLDAGPRALPSAR